MIHFHIFTTSFYLRSLQIKREKTHLKKGKTWNHLNWFKSVFITINHKNQIDFNQAKKMKVLFLFSSVYCASSAKMLFLFYDHTQDRAFGSYHSTMKNLHLHTTLVDGPQPKQIYWRSKCFFFLFYCCGKFLL